MSQDDNNNIFFGNEPSKEPEQPQPPASPEPEPFNLGGGAQVYPAEPQYETPPPQPLPPYGQPPVPPKKSNRTIWIIVIVALVLLCCCCLAIALTWLWNNGDAILEQLELSSLLPAALSLLA